MIKTFITLIFAISAITFCHAQKIEATKVFGGYKYTQNGTKMTMKDLVQTMKADAKSYQLIKKAQSDNTIASIIGFAGGALVGWPVGAAIGGGDPNWTLAAIGAGLIVVAIPIGSGANKKANLAVETYNKSLGITSFNEIKPKFNLILNGNGIGLSVNF